MKKLLLSAVASVALVGVAQADSFNGMSAGAHLGLSFAKAKIKNSDNDFNGVTFKDHKSTGVPLGLHLTWAQSENDGLYYGAELGLGYEFGGRKSTKIASRDANNYADLKVERGLYGEVVPKVGMRFADQYIAYGLVSLNMQSAKYKISGKMDGVAGAINKKKAVGGIALGLGYERAIDNEWTVGAEYRYNMRSTVKFDDDTKFKNAAHDFRLRVSMGF